MTLDTYEIMQLEKQMLPPERWSEAPENVRKIAEKCSDEGIPTGIAKHDKLGWCILHAGQGPYIAWSEHNQKGN